MAVRTALLGLILVVAGCAPQLRESYESARARPGSEMYFLVSSASGTDPYKTGRLAAERLSKRLLHPPHAVIVAECFDGEARKREALRGICSVLPREAVFGGATYGAFTHAGVGDRDSVALLAIAGEGISVAAALQQNLGTAKLSAEKDQAEIQQRLRAAGAALAAKLPKSDDRRLAIVIADAHSPKNAPLVEGLQEGLSKSFPITGGAVNKNAGQTYVYFQGRMFQDSAVALMLSGALRTAMVGRQAKEGAQVVATAGEAAASAFQAFRGQPVAVLAFDCAGRKGKLANVEDELLAIRKAVGAELPLFGCYCAGEIGPPEGSKPNSPSVGVGWHIMLTVIGR
ncbi:MAG: hypothetical protein FJ291_23025 [Planctomycetes bacterium]|nr:hypothetical protein [Planctomycetota bacterium]